ncbi:MAG TPA: polyhydroxyalkanoate synthesis regulator DNA-binding domain-containing protein [Deltaproteobacteria bacterium]|nr:polyhydroxyalkanoate synthesis regulator DNA-binding domain-containing protein [Deltaproteobacteria bacterium]HPR55528.1 polyhydroxyalkanoate synthesis regulator DNA-binding domain-containing protein [Deltaproteobacteria bacterium]HXK48348.1 polyhydroxyalkanoate synthesis regulator DNA-binding domain-containing protein [Deltaproteobacteria bacterium]
MSETIVLKKYASRRLYNPENSSYVTLSQVSDIIRSGKDVQVLDAKTGEDVTAFILTQIIMEEARNSNALLPSPLLHLIIRSGGTVLQEFFEKHLQDAINSYLQLKTAFDAQFSKWLNMGVNYSDMARTAMKDMPSFPGFFTSADAPSPEKASKKKKGG